LSSQEESPPLPYRSQTPGIGGTLRGEIDDFEVEEIPAYPPSGTGDHVMIWIEKRDLTTGSVVQALARELRVSPKDIGVAGLKDKRALARQMLSLPPPTSPKAALQLQIEGVRILSAERHGNKLKTGHLRGNTFHLVVRNLQVPHLEALERARAILEELSRPPGAPNWFGMQRFGRDGDNAEVGRALVKKEKLSRPAPKHKMRRLYVSAYQSELFNRYLALRLNSARYDQILSGDVLQKRDSGGIFCSDEVSVDQKRLEAGEVCITGPMFGHRMRTPTPQSPAAELEEELLRGEGIEAKSFAHLGKIALGTRRALAVIPENVGALPWQSAENPDANAIRVSFSLPAGSYATAIMRELIKGPTPFPN
jgi:tRNA pseudouridine13 synthase